MTRIAKLAVFAVFVAVFALAGMASAQDAPALPVQPATVAPVAAVSQPAAVVQAPTVDLSQIFAAPSTEGISTVPAPVFKSCTVFQCRQLCKVPGCTSVCLSVETCECDVICP
jgi:hypothetical protein